MKSEQNSENEGPRRSERGSGFYERSRGYTRGPFFLLFDPPMNEWILSLFNPWSILEMKKVTTSSPLRRQTANCKERLGESKNGKACWGFRMRQAKHESRTEKQKCCDKEIMELCWKWKYLKSLILGDFERRGDIPRLAKTCWLWLCRLANSQTCLIMLLTLMWGRSANSGKEQKKFSLLTIFWLSLTDSEAVRGKQLHLFCFNNSSICKRPRLQRTHIWFTLQMLSD